MRRHWFVLVVFLLALLVAFPLGAQDEKKEESKKEEAQTEETKKEEEPVIPQPVRPKNLQEAVEQAELIFVGIVDYVGDKPDGWGKPPLRPTTQMIRYEVVKFLKGNYPAKKITVFHELFQGSKTAATQPGLNPEIFDIDKKVILLLSIQPYSTEGAHPVTFIPVDPDFGACAWTEEMEKQISGMVK